MVMAARARRQHARINDRAILDRLLRAKIALCWCRVADRGHTPRRNLDRVDAPQRRAALVHRLAKGGASTWQWPSIMPGMTVQPAASLTVASCGGPRRLHRADSHYPVALDVDDAIQDRIGAGRVESPAAPLMIVCLSAAASSQA